MPRYFFDIYDGHTERDDVGTEFPGPREAALHAKRILPEIAIHEGWADGHCQAFTVLVTDEEDHPVYSAALCCIGTWLLR